MTAVCHAVCLPPLRVHTHANTGSYNPGLGGSSDPAFSKLSELPAPQTGGNPDSPRWVIELPCCQM